MIVYMINNTKIFLVIFLKEKDIIELIYYDVYDLIDVETFSISRYFIAFIDYHKRFKYLFWKKNTKFYNTSSNFMLWCKEKKWTFLKYFYNENGGKYT